MDAFPRRLQQCIHVGGGHLTDVIFKKRWRKCTNCKCKCISFHFLAK
jgi:hypothetical protein